MKEVIGLPLQPGLPSLRVKQDRRKYPRLKIPLELEYQLEDNRLCQQATLIDLSAGGVAMMTDDPLPAGGQLAFVRFKLDYDTGDGPATVIEAETEVVRCIRREGIGRRSEYLVGVRFANLSERDFSHLKQFVDERLAQEAAKGRAPSRRMRCEQPITIQYRRFDDFVNEVATNLSLTGMFIRAKRPRPPGSILDFSFQLGDDFNLIHGQAEVVWTRPLAEGPERPAGMGIRFLELDEVSQRVLEQILEKGLGHEAGTGDAAAADADAAARIAELESERDSLTARLEQTRQELEQARTAAEEAQRPQAEAEAELARLISVAEEREVELARLAADAETRDADLARLAADVETRDAELARLAADVETRDAELARLAADVETRDAELARLTAATKDRESELQRLAAAAERHQAEVESAAARVGQIERKHHAANSRAAGLDDRLSSALTRVAELEQELAAAQDREGEHEESRARLESRLAEAEADREQLGHRGDELSATLDRLREDRETLRRELQELERTRGEELEREREAAAERASDLECRLEAAGREAEAREGEIERLGEALAEAQGLAVKLEQTRADRDAAARQIEVLEARATEIESAGAARERQLEERITELDAEIERLRSRLQAADDDTRGVREELERAEHERGLSTARCERLSFQLTELQHDAEERRRAHRDEIALRDATAERERQEGEARILELEHELELAKQAGGELRAEVEQLTSARSELTVRMEQLVQEADELRRNATDHERTLREEIGTLEGRIARLDWESEEQAKQLERTIAELRQEIAAGRAKETRLNASWKEAVARVEDLETGLTGARQLESRRLEDVAALRADLEAERARREALEAEITEEAARAVVLADEKRELEAAQLGLVKEQRRLQKNLAATTKKLSKRRASVARLAGGASTGSQTIRRGSLRAAALVGFGLILGFIASYPFETLLVSADPIAIPTSRAIDFEPARAAPPPPLPGEELSVTPADAAPEPSVPPAAPEADRPAPVAAVERWAAAWSEQRVADYLAAYASSFEVPDGLERGAWELQRAERIERPESIEITLDRFDTAISGPDSATVRFVQSYAAGAYRDRVAKTLDLVWEAGAWRILRESAIELE